MDPYSEAELEEYNSYFQRTKEGEVYDTFPDMPGTTKEAAKLHEKEGKFYCGEIVHDVQTLTKHTAKKHGNTMLSKKDVHDI